MMSNPVSPEPVSLTPAQCKAARALLGWSQQDLAGKASVATSTVADFERGFRSPVANNLQAMKAAIEAAGVSLPAGGAVAGPPFSVSPKSNVSPEKLKPVRWVTETDLSQWADRRDGQDKLPELIRRLIIAEKGYFSGLRFPSGDSVQMHGWDGECSVEVGTDFIPQGLSGWELGTSQEPAKKAEDDFVSRSKKPLHLKPSIASFVFVTPRRWAAKAAWVKSKKAEKVWKDVRAYDAVDLVEWIERFPAVGLWFANLIGKIPADVRLLEEVWREWSLATKIPLTPQLVLLDRDEMAVKVWSWLKGAPSHLTIQAEDADEAIAFLYAAIDQMPQGYRDFFHCRAVVVADPDTARRLSDVPTPLIFVLENGEPGLVSQLVTKGHHVFVALGWSAVKEALSLPRPLRYSIEQELEKKNSGYTSEEAKNLAHDSARSLTILRRLAPAAPNVQSPEWATDDKARVVIPALLAGAWVDTEQADKDIIEHLSGMSYSDVAEQLTPILTLSESPLRKAGPAWKIASPRDAWFRIAHLLTARDLTRFAKAAEQVLGSVDPRFHVAPEERWRADLDSTRSEYSNLLRTGISEILVLLGLFGDRVTGVANANQITPKIVKSLLGGADGQRWWSLRSQLQMLAEASPEEFLSAVEDSLDNPDSPLLKLFNDRQGSDTFFGGGADHSHLLWALEVLSWSPDYLARVTLILVKLTEIDPGGTYANRPKNTFQQIFRLWYPQTNATLAERLKVLDLARKAFPDTSWELLLNLYPRGHDHTTIGPIPRWRDFTSSQTEIVTQAVVRAGANAVGEWLLTDVGLDVDRWTKLLERYSDFAPAHRTKLRELLSEVASKIKDDSIKDQFRAALRRHISHHREFADTKWATAEDELSNLELIYQEFEPKDLGKRHAWMFGDHRAALINPEGHDWRANEEASDRIRNAAVAELHTALGEDGIFEFAKTVRLPALLGKSLNAVLERGKTDSILKRALNTEGDPNWDIAHGIILARYQDRTEAWADELIDRAISEKWSDDALGRIFLSLPIGEHVLRRADAIGGPVTQRFWKNANLHYRSVPADSVPWVLQKLLDAKRARHAVHFAGEFVAAAPSNLLIKALRQAVAETGQDDHNEQTMFQHYVETILGALDKRDDFEAGEIARLEWAYLQMLEYPHQRQATALPKLLATNPEFFVEVLSIVYRKKNEPKTDSEELSEEARSIVTQAWRLLHSWAHPPGLKDGQIDGAALESWVAKARKLCAEADREVIGDQQIGQVLAHAPSDPDGKWPCKPVRDVIEITRSRDLETGFMVGVSNKRGITTRMPSDGGAQERELANTYRLWSKAVRLDTPRTSAVLEKIAEGYEVEAKRHDEDAERGQW